MNAEDKDLNQLLQKVFEERGLDFRQYHQDMLKRRLARRLSATGTTSYHEYAKTLDVHPDEYKKLLDSLLINVSHFFRNPLTFEFLHKVVLPEMLERKERFADKIIRIWSAGCAQGEEPYSIAIVLAELLGKRLKNYNVTVYATDTDSDAMDKAKNGEYPEDSILEVKKGILNKYFLSRNGSYRVREDIKVLVDFSFHDLTSEKTVAPVQSVFANFDLIFCRNVLIYFTKDLQKKVLGNFKTVLNEKGYLVLGEAETLSGIMHTGFVCVDSFNKIYQKIGGK
jgi:chemotaxis methyl-accepting protein methylase